MIPFALAFLSGSNRAQMLVKKIHLAHTRPSRLAKMFTQDWRSDREDERHPSTTLLTEGLQLTWDDDHGNLILMGQNRDDLDDFTRLISLFDVEQQKVGISMKLESSLDKSTTSSFAEIENKHLWTQKDETIGFSFQVTPRVNADGSITMFARISEDASATEGGLTIAYSRIVRLKSGDAVTFRILRNASLELSVMGKPLGEPSRPENEVLMEPAFKATPIEFTVVPTLLASKK